MKILPIAVVNLVATAIVPTAAVVSAVWTPPIDSMGVECGGTSIKTGDGGAYTCFTSEEAICRDNYPGSFGSWMFVIKDGTVQLLDPNNQVSWQFCDEVTHVCIGEDRADRVADPGNPKFSQQRPYMFFYNEKTQEKVGELLCDGTDGLDGENLDRPSLLKMVDNSMLGGYVHYGSDGIPVVKFKKGQTDDPEDLNSLWQIAVNATGAGTQTYNEHKCTWTQVCNETNPRGPGANPPIPPTNFTDFPGPILRVDAEVCTTDFKLPPTCTQGWVRYENGIPQDGGNCGSGCCIGEEACEGFTGSVCKDGSCNGTSSCASANVEYIGGYRTGLTSNRPSCVGYLACAQAKGRDGRRGQAIEGGSCTQYEPYEDLPGPSGFWDYGLMCIYAEVDIIQNESCQGPLSCQSTQGTIISDSCRGFASCGGTGNFDKFDVIQQSCNDICACQIEMSAGVSGGDPSKRPRPDVFCDCNSPFECWGQTREQGYFNSCCYAARASGRSVDASVDCPAE